MRAFCTLSDKNYLANGMVLYDTLCKFYGNDFILYYLCVDSYTLDFMNTHTPANISHITPDQLEAECYKLLIENHESRPIDVSDGQSPYHWALAPLFTNWILQHHDECLYVDSDIMFYRDPEEIFQSVKDCDVGLITHKHCRLEKTKSNVGYYNVGIIYFENSTFGSACCRWWRDVVVDTSNPWFHPYGSCGDQKYLEIFEDIFPLLKIKIIDEDIGHSAPWNLGPSKLDWVNKTYTWPSDLVIPDSEYCCQPLHFHHFSHFTPNYKNNTWSHQRGNEWGNCVDTPDKTQMYNEYFDTLQNIKEKYGI